MRYHSHVYHKAALSLWKCMCVRAYKSVNVMNNSAASTFPAFCFFYYNTEAFNAWCMESLEDKQEASLWMLLLFSRFAVDSVLLSALVSSPEAWFSLGPCTAIVGPLAAAVAAEVTASENQMKQKLVWIQCTTVTWLSNEAKSTCENPSELKTNRTSMENKHD